jgi:hypothetical protein
MIRDELATELQEAKTSAVNDVASMVPELTNYLRVADRWLDAKSSRNEPEEDMLIRALADVSRAIKAFAKIVYQLPGA